VTTKTRAQIHMEDNIVEDAELEKMLEGREELKHSAADFRKADKEAKERIRSIETPTPYRIGRFIISRAPRPARSVAFDTAEGISISIKTVDESSD